VTGAGPVVFSLLSFGISLRRSGDTFPGTLTAAVTQAYEVDAMNTAIEERIRNRAYELWEAEGRPEGREIDHWLQAVQELALERSAVGVASSPRPRRTRSTAGTATAKRTTRS
jgi:hypothetical protein